jgi:hypothetical protein
MALTPLRPRLRNVSNGLAKVTLSIPAGDEIEVSEEVAAQIIHQGAPLRDAAPSPEPESTEAPKPARKARAAKKASA